MCAISSGFQSLLSPSAHWREVIWYALESQDLNRRAHYFSSQRIPAGRLTPVWDIPSYVFPLFLRGMAAGLREGKEKKNHHYAPPALALSVLLRLVLYGTLCSCSFRKWPYRCRFGSCQWKPTVIIRGARERGFIGHDPIVKDTGFCSVTQRWKLWRWKVRAFCMY